MAVNVLGTAHIKILPQLVWGNLGQEIRRQLQPVADAAGRIRGGLDDAGDAARRAAGDVGDVGDAARRAAGDADRLRAGLEEAGQAGAGAARDTESAWDKALGALKDKAKGAFAGVGAAIGVTLGASVWEAVEQQSGQGRLQAALGVDPAEAQRLGKIAGSLYASAYGESLDDVNAAITSVVRNVEGMGSASDEVLKAFTGQAISVADVMGADVAEVTRAVGRIMANDLAPSAEAALDVITRGTQLGGNQADDLLDTFSEYSPMFAQLGLSGEQAMGLLVQGLRGGARDTDFLADAIKEFTLLVQAMPPATATAFSDLGLDARQLQADIGAGGERAAAAFNTILGALRAVEDPIRQNQIAVGLFGTKAEDLQDALFALDPSTAVAALGQVGGAARQLDTDLNSNAKTALTSLKRTLETELANIGNVVLPPLAGLATRITEAIGPTFDTAKLGVKGFFSAFQGEGITSDGFVGVMERIGVAARDIGGTLSTAWQLALPGLRDLGSFITDSVWPALQNLWAVVKGLWPDIQAVGRIVGAVLLVAFRAVGEVLSNVVGPILRELTELWRNNQTTITALAVAIGVGVLAWKAYQLAVAAVTTAQWLWQTRTLIMGALMRAFQGGIMAVRGAMLALNTAFLANPFAIVIAAVVALVAAFIYAWKHSETFRNVVTGVLNALKTAFLVVFGAIRDFFVAVWQGMYTAGSAVWNAISAAISAVWNAIKLVTSLVWDGIKLYFTVWWTVLSTAFQVALNVIQTVISTVWNAIKTVTSLVWDGIKLYFTIWWTVLSTVFSAALNTVQLVITGAWNAISTATSTIWNTIKTIFTTAVNAIHTTAVTVMNLVKGAFDTALNGIKTAFQTVKDGIKTIWDGLKTVAAAPVKFVVETVYNNGIRKAWNAIVAKIPGVPDMPALSVPGLAKGGPITGGTPGRDSVLRWLMPGEHVLTKDEVDAMGGHQAVFAFRRALGGGGQAQGPGMLLGGVGKALGSAWEATGGRVVDFAEDVLREGIAKAFELAVNPLRGALNATLGRGDNWSGVINRLIQTPFDKLIEWVRNKEAETTPDVGPAGAAPPKGEIQTFAKALLDARGWGGQWAAFNALVMGESGWNPRATNPSSGAYGIPQALPPSKLDAYGNRHDYRVQLRWMLDYIAQRYGTPANAYATWQRRSPHWYDQGGPLHPGWTLAYNGTGQDEWVFPSRQIPRGVLVAPGAIRTSIDARGATDPAAVEAAVQRANTELLHELTRLLQQGEGDH